MEGALCSDVAEGCCDARDRPGATVHGDTQHLAAEPHVEPVPGGTQVLAAAQQVSAGAAGVDLEVRGYPQAGSGVGNVEQGLKVGTLAGVEDLSCDAFTGELVRSLLQQSGCARIAADDEAALRHVSELRWPAVWGLAEGLTGVRLPQ